MPAKIKKRFGYIPDPIHAKKFVESLPYPRLPRRLIKQASKRDVFLWLAKNQVQPDWKRGAQGIGDCVSWGAELACTCLLWNLALQGEIEFEAEAATESIYGLCRVELHGKPEMGNEDGAAGSWAAEALNKWGILLRKDYSKETGNEDHDLTRYSAKRAKSWGYYGCGGENDKDSLDAIAKLYPVQEIAQVKNPDDVHAAIDSGCTVTIASQVGFEGDRDDEGIIHPNGSWPHQMCVLGVKFTTSGNRLFRIFNSWNGSVKGPDPGIDDDAVSECSWWTDDDAIHQIVGEDDSYALSHVKGFTQKPYDFDTNLF